MLRMHARAAAVVVVCNAVGAILTPAAAQHEHHAALDTVKVRAERDVIQLRSGATIVDVRGSAAAGAARRHCTTFDDTRTLRPAVLWLFIEILAADIETHFRLQ